MTEDGQWMRDVFDTTRGEEEPAWFPDAQAMIGSGDRRRRMRAVGAGSGSLAVVAAAAIAVSVAAPGGGGRSTTAPPDAPPTKSQPTRSQGTIFDRVNFMPLQRKNMSPDAGKQPKFVAVPEAAVSDMAALLAELDPTSSHIVPTPNQGIPAKAVPFGDPDGDNLAGLQVNSAWTPTGKPAAQGGAGIAKLPVTPNGNLLTRFLDGDDAKFQATMPGCGAADDLGEAWSTLNRSASTPNAPDQAAWSACDHRQLGDGSTLASSTKSFGSFTAVFAARQFPGGAGTVETLWLNYSIKQVTNGVGPNPDTVLSPSPLTVQKLTAALSGSGIVPGLKATKAVTVSPKLLQASDFGTGWKVDSVGTTDRLASLVPDACAGVQSDLVAGSATLFSGPAPSGLNVRAGVFQLTVGHGTGAQKLAALRHQAETGCGSTAVTSLSGLGDGGFVESIPGLPSQPWNVFIRFGDTILQINVNGPEDSPAFTQADKQWLTDLATKATTRFTTKS